MSLSVKPGRGAKALCLGMTRDEATAFLGEPAAEIEADSLLKLAYPDRDISVVLRDGAVDCLYFGPRSGATCGPVRIGMEPDQLPQNFMEVALDHDRDGVEGPERCLDVAGLTVFLIGDPPVVTAYQVIDTAIESEVQQTLAREAPHLIAGEASDADGPGAPAPAPTQEVSAEEDVDDANDTAETPMLDGIYRESADAAGAPDPRDLPPGPPTPATFGLDESPSFTDAMPRVADSLDSVSAMAHVTDTAHAPPPPALLSSGYGMTRREAEERNLVPPPPDPEQMRMAREMGGLVAEDESDRPGGIESIDDDANLPLATAVSGEGGNAAVSFPGDETGPTDLMAAARPKAPDTEEQAPDSGPDTEQAQEPEPEPEPEPDRTQPDEVDDADLRVNQYAPTPTPKDHRPVAKGGRLPFNYIYSVEAGIGDVYFQLGMTREEAYAWIGDPSGGRGAVVRFPGRGIELRFVEDEVVSITWAGDRSALFLGPMRPSYIDVMGLEIGSPTSAIKEQIPHAERADRPDASVSLYELPGLTIAHVRGEVVSFTVYSADGRPAILDRD